MATDKIEEFTKHIRDAGVTVTELSKTIKLGADAIRILDDRIMKADKSLEAMKSRQAALVALSKNPFTPASAVKGIQDQAKALDPLIAQRKKLSELLVGQKQGITELIPSNYIVGATKAMDTILTKITTVNQAIATLGNTNPTQLAALQKQLSGLNRSLTRRRSEVAGYGDLIASVREPITPGQQMGDLDARLKQTGKEIGTKVVTLQSLQSQLAAATTAGNVGGIATLTKQIANLDKGLALAEAKARKLASALSALQAANPGVQLVNNTPYPRAPQTQNLPDFMQNWQKMNPVQQQAQYLKDMDEAIQRQSVYSPEASVGDRWSKAREVAATKGYKPEDLTSVTEKGMDGIQRATWRTTDALTGADRSLQLFTDRAGRVIPTTSRQFSTFGSSVSRDLMELTKWSIAISLIYGPMRKLQELVTLMIANEVSLADASIAVSDSTLKMGQIFDIANDAANAMGENVTEVIVNFKEAYQATGGMGNAMERTAAATQLMNDALILSKLTSLTATQSIDTLASALRQSSGSLDTNKNVLMQGTTLLDQWVKVSKVANVSVDTLATGFSVLGEAANAAGLSNEQLNAILAVTSETMGVSGREAANMARAFVAGFQSDKATKALESIGIATTDTTGKMRTLLDIQRDLYTAKTIGTISPATYSQLTLAIGGGTRRQAPTAGFIESFPRIAQIVDAQSNVSGQAAEALAKQLDTVQTAMTRLQNAFQSLAQSLGDEGGLLNLFQTVLDIFTGIISAADKISASIGKATTTLTIAAAGFAFLQTRGPLFTKNIADTLGLNTTLLTGGTENIGAQQRGSFMQNMILGKGLGPRLAGAAGSALLMGGLPALGNIQAYRKGEDPAGMAKAGANIGGAIVGAVMGSLIPGGTIIGAAIGSAAGEAMVNTATEELNAFNPQKPEYIMGMWGNPDYSAEPSANTYLNPSGSGWKQLDAAQNAFWKNLMNWSKSLWQPSNTGTPKATTETELYNQLNPEQKKEYDKWYANQIATGAVSFTPESAPFELATKEQQTKNATYLDTIQKQREQEFLTQLIQGKMTPTAYTGKMETLGTFDEKAARFYTAFGEEFLKVSDDINTAEEAYSAFLDIFTYGSAEQIGSLTSMVTEVADLTTGIQKLKEIGTPDALALIPGKQAEIERIQGILAQSTNVMYKQAKIEQYPVPKMINMNEPLIGSNDQIKQAIQRAKAQEMAFYTSPGLGAAQKTPEDVGIMRSAMEDFGVVIEEGGNEVYYSFTELAKKLGEGGDKVGEDWFQKVIDEMILTGELKVSVEAQGNQWGGQLDIPKSMEGLVNSWIGYFSAMFTNWGIPLKEEVQVVRFEDGQFGQFRGDSKVIAAALGQIQQTEQKQLEQGMWNIPEGATFWVPINSLTSANQPQGTGISGKGPPAVTPGPVGSASDPLHVVVDGTVKEGPVQRGHGESDIERRDRQQKDKATAERLYYGEDYALRHPGATGFPAQPKSFTKETPYVPRWDKGEGQSPFNKIYEAVINPENQKLPSFDFLGGIWEMFKGIPDTFKKRWDTLFGYDTGTGVSAGKPLLNPIKPIEFGNQNIPIITKTSLNLTNTTTLTLDGRILAIAIKKYLATDLNNSQSTFGGGSVVI